MLQQRAVKTKEDFTMAASMIVDVDESGSN
jgi:hypothetical protein